MIDSLDANSRALLINALYFKSKWDEDYEDSQINKNWDFKTSNGISKCTMLCSDEDGHYLTDDKIDACYKYYKDSNYAFLGMYAHDESVPISDIIDYLDGNKFFDLWHSGSNKYNAYYKVSQVEVTCRIPEFEVETSVDLNSMLENDYDTDVYNTTIKNSVTAFLNDYTVGESFHVADVIHFIRSSYEDVVINVILPNTKDIELQKNQLVRPGSLTITCINQKNWRYD